jgi:hypothetical protein
VDMWLDARTKTSNVVKEDHTLLKKSHLIRTSRRPREWRGEDIGGQQGLDWPLPPGGPGRSDCHRHWMSCGDGCGIGGASHHQRRSYAHLRSSELGIQSETSRAYQRGRRRGWFGFHGDDAGSLEGEGVHRWVEKHHLAGDRRWGR